jgi:hypothetical protein
MPANPLIDRYRCTLLRPAQFWIYISIYAAILALLFFINFAGYQTSELFEEIQALYASLYFQFLVLQVFVFIFWTAYNSGSAIRAEISNNSYDFFRMLPLSASKKALGILIGKNLVALLLGGINFLLMLVFGTLGGINSLLQLQVFVTMISLALFSNSLALLISINSAKRKGSRNTGIFSIIFIVLFVLPIAANGLFALSEIDELQGYPIDFYSLGVPVLVLITLLALHFSAWAFAGIIRKFTKEEQPLFSRPGAFLFLLAYDFIMLGLISPHFQKGLGAVYGFWVAVFVPILIIPLGSMRSLSSYFEHTGTLKTRNWSAKHPAVSMFAFSNFSLGLGLFGIWAALAITTGISVSDGVVGVGLRSVAVFFSFYLFLLLLLELYVLLSPRYPMIGYLLGFAAFLYLALPLIIGGIFRSTTAPAFSLLGAFVYIFDEEPLSAVLFIAITGLNLIICIPPAIIAVSRYRHLLNLRKTM